MVKNKDDAVEKEKEENIVELLLKRYLEKDNNLNHFLGWKGGFLR